MESLNSDSASFWLYDLPYLNLSEAQFLFSNL